jgi:hypothetical protein
MYDYAAPDGKCVGGVEQRSATAPNAVCLVEPPVAKLEGMRRSRAGIERDG